MPTDYATKRARCYHDFVSDDIATLNVICATVLCAALLILHLSHGPPAPPRRTNRQCDMPPRDRKASSSQVFFGVFA